MTALGFLTGFSVRGWHVAILFIGRDEDIHYVMASIETDAEMRECLVMERGQPIKVLWNPPLSSVLPRRGEIVALWSHENAEYK